jgi:hypothetical protein
MQYIVSEDVLSNVTAFLYQDKDFVEAFSPN